MIGLITEPLDKRGEIKPETEALFWECFDNPKNHINEKEVDKELLRLDLISHALEAGEAAYVIDSALRSGSIAKYNTMTFIKTTNSEKYLKVCRERDELRAELTAIKKENRKNRMIFVSPDKCNRVFAGALLSKDGCYFEVDENNKLVGFVSKESYDKEFTQTAI